MQNALLLLNTYCFIYYFYISCPLPLRPFSSRSPNKFSFLCHFSDHVVFRLVSRNQSLFSNHLTNSQLFTYCCQYFICSPHILPVFFSPNIRLKIFLSIFAHFPPKRYSAPRLHFHTALCFL